MQIRIMTVDDYVGLYALWTSCKGMGLNDVDDSAEGIERYLRRNPSTCFVAVEAGEIVGCIMAGHDGRRGYIYHTAVKPERRVQGIGKALVDAAMAALREEGISKVALVAFSRNEAGNAFWERMGFTRRDDLSYRNKTLADMNRMDT